MNPLKRQVKCIAVNRQGSLLALGEHDCKQPAVVILHILSTHSPTVLHTIKGHRHGIQHLVFSPQGDYLVSIGNQLDNGLFIYQCQQQQWVRVSQNKLSRPVEAVHMDGEQRQLATCGKGYIKVYDLKDKQFERKECREGVWIIEGRQCHLGEQFKQKMFISLQYSGQGQLVALTSCGLVCLLSRAGQLQKYMDIKASESHVLLATQNLLVVGNGGGLLRLFALPQLTHLQSIQAPSQASIVCLQLDQEQNKLLTLQSDYQLEWWGGLNVDVQWLGNGGGSVEGGLLDIDVEEGGLWGVGAGGMFEYNYQQQHWQREYLLGQGVGMRSVQVKGAVVVCGDTDGRLYTYYHHQLQQVLQVHDQEVLCLHLLQHHNTLYLLSGSRDTLLHLFKCKIDEVKHLSIQLLITLNIHRSSVTRGILESVSDGI